MNIIFSLLFLLVSLLFIGCDKPNPTPEVLDPIYIDLSKQADEAKKLIPEAKIAVSEAEKELTLVKPQTGQIEYAKKRLREANQRLVQTTQIAKYLEIHSKSRLDYDRESYLVAWKQKKQWPDPAEYKEFKDAEKAQSARTNWNVKDRMKEAGVPATEQKQPKKESESEKKEEH